MKNPKNICICLLSVLVAAILLFLIDFRFFASPRYYERPNGEKVKYYTTLLGNDYTTEGKRIIPTAFPQK